MEFTKQQLKAAFERLSVALAKQPLDTSDGKKRQAEASEFMLMHRNGNLLGFKHGDSRNYVFLRDDGELIVPKTAEPFMRGTFDVF